jgi:hypothetical protein
MLHLKRETEHSRTDDASMTIDRSLFLDKIACTQDRDRSSRKDNNKAMNEAKHDYKHVIDKHA